MCVPEVTGARYWPDLNCDFRISTNPIKLDQMLLSLGHQSFGACELYDPFHFLFYFIFFWHGVPIKIP